MSTKQEVIAWFLNILDELQTDNENITLYRNLFNSLSNKDLKDLAKKLASGEELIRYYCPNLHSKDVEKDNILKVGDKLGVRFFQRLTLIDPVTQIPYQTKNRYLICHLMLRRQQQHVSKGLRVADDNTHNDILTGQATGPSSTVKTTAPELGVIANAGLMHTALELTNVRGGNEAAFRQAKLNTLQTGKFTLAEVKELGTRPTVLHTVNNILLGMHFKSNL